MVKSMVLSFTSACNRDQPWSIAWFKCLVQEVQGKRKEWNHCVGKFQPFDSKPFIDLDPYPPLKRLTNRPFVLTVTYREKGVIVNFFQQQIAGLDWC